MAAHDPPPPSRVPTRAPYQAAAFFDLDKTVIAKASMMAFSGPLHRAGLVSRRMLLRAAWAHLVYVQFGASAERLERLRASVLRLTRGWDQAEISAIVRSTLEEVIEPIIFDEALELIEQHRAAGHRVVIVSASPEEVVAPIAQRLGVDEAVATRAELDSQGRYTGRTERYVYGPEKAVAITELAQRHGIDLAASWAYSDSITDVPMLAAVGHPVAVNPDRDLARVARAKGWEIRRFRRTVAMRDRRPVRTPPPATLLAGTAAGVGAAGAFWWWRAGRPGEAVLRSAGQRAARSVDQTVGQTVRTFFAAKAAKPTRTRSSRSFFMAAEPTRRRVARAMAGLVTAEVDGNRTRRAGIARATGFEGRGAHQVLAHLHVVCGPSTGPPASRIHGNATRCSAWRLRNQTT